MDLASKFKPLYRRVEELLTKRICDGEWKPAQIIPNEHALAAELGVSQGTVRKALNVMVSHHLLERRQGKGTFVAEHTEEKSSFRFSRLAHPGGIRVTPTEGKETLALRKATPLEVEKLGLLRGEKVYEIKRTRLVDGKVAIYDVIVLASSVFPGLEKHVPLPHVLYAFYQSAYGVNVVSVEEEIRADYARAEDVKRLNLRKGAPLLHINRVALSMDGARVEWRMSRYVTSKYVYAIELS